ncbi:MAG: hypothetical protein IT273_14695 [Chitinophagales bacterium]|nr:hypothetical protein [Chitinophagales bacterium]
MPIELPNNTTTLIGIRRSVTGGFVKVSLQNGRVLSIPLSSAMMSETAAILRGLTNKNIADISPSNLLNISREVDSYISDIDEGRTLLYPSNLYLMGIGRNENGNYISVSFGKSRLFSIPLDALPNTKLILGKLGNNSLIFMLLGEMDDDAYKIGMEVYRYVCVHGTARQKSKIGYFAYGKFAKFQQS